MALATRDCKELHTDWERYYDERHTQQVPAWALIVACQLRERSCDPWMELVKEQYELRQRAIRPYRWRHQPKPHADTLDRLFHEQAERWKDDTQHWSSVTKMIAHPSYLRIIALAQRNKRELLALLLNELRQEPDHWFAALTAITGHDPVRPEDDFDQSVNAWIEWGCREGILEDDEDHHPGGVTEEVPEAPSR